MRTLRAHPSAGAAGLVVLLALAALARTRTPEAAASAADVAPPTLPAPPDAGVAEAAQREPAAARALREGQPLDVNRASAADLELLPRIGPALAGRIVAHRDAHGAFASVEALGEVRGIGPRTIEHLRPLVTVTEP